MLSIISIAGCSGRAGGVNVWNAVSNDNAAQIKKYSQAGGDLNVRAMDGTTPLFRALTEKKQAAYFELLNLGADPNIIGQRGKVVVNWAAAENDSSWLKAALEHGGDPNLFNHAGDIQMQGTPLPFAAAQGTLENVKLLVEHGADIGAICSDGHTSLSYMMELGRYDMVLFLLDRGSDYRVPLDFVLYNHF